jgi:hypothetical protein
MTHNHRIFLEIHFFFRIGSNAYGVDVSGDSDVKFINCLNNNTFIEFVYI